MSATTLTPARTWQLLTKARRAGSLDITLILLGIVAVFCLLDFQHFLTMANLVNIGISSSILLVMAVGATFVLISAGIDLSCGSVLVFSGVMAGMVMQAMGGSGWGASWAGVAASIAAGAAWGLVNGLVVTLCRVPPMVATLGSFGAAMGLAQVLCNGNDFKDIPTQLVDTLGVGRLAGVPYLIIVALLIAAIGGVTLSRTGFGRRTYAIGSNAEAARRSGIPVTAHLLRVYLLAGALAGVAGIMSFALYGSTTIAGHSTDNMAVIAAVVIGGTSLFGGAGSMFGTVIGVLIPSVLANGLVIVGLNSFWRDFVVGVVLVLAVYLDQLRRRSRAGS